MFLQSKYGVHITTVDGVEFDFKWSWRICVLRCSYRVNSMSILKLPIERSMILMVILNMCF